MATQVFCIIVWKAISDTAQHAGRVGLPLLFSSSQLSSACKQTGKKQVSPRTKRIRIQAPFCSPTKFDRSWKAIAWNVTAENRLAQVLIFQHAKDCCVAATAECRP